MVIKHPQPYPQGEPCGIIGHFVWCRCTPPMKNNPKGYGPGEIEYERVRKRNQQYQKRK